MSETETTPTTVIVCSATCRLWGRCPDRSVCDAANRCVPQK